MVKSVLSLSIILATCLTAAPLLAQTSTTVKVVGYSDKKNNCNTSPAEQHQACSDTIAGSHWCSTQEYLDGGMAMDADEELETSWIRPVIVSTSFSESLGLIYVDASAGATTYENLNCLQWSSKSSSNSGPVLQTTDGDREQIVVLKDCSKKYHSLCCAPVAD